MIKILKSNFFLRQEVKYLKKLTPKQIGQYDEKIKLFKESIFPNHSKINTHSLS
jgi:hypothetical protein